MRQRYNLTLDADVVQKADEFALKNGMSRSRFIEATVKRGVEELKKHEMDRLAAIAYEAMGESDIAEAEAGIDEWSELVSADPFDWTPEESSDE